MARPRIAWLVATLGYGDSLLYWERILAGYCATFPHTRIFTSGPKRLSIVDTLPLDRPVSLWRIRIGATRHLSPVVVTLPTPAVLPRVVSYAPDLIVLSEFGILTIYGLLVKLLRPRTRILLLVESDPSPLSARASWWFRSILRRLLSRAASHILTNNPAGQHYLVSKLGISPNKVTQGPYLISSPQTEPKWSEPDSNELLWHSLEEFVAILYVGQLIPRKGVADLVRAVEILPGNVRKRLRVWIAGDGADAPMLRSMVTNCGLNEVVRFFGTVHYPRIALMYRAADVFVLPTRQDYRALVGFEALSFGLPLIHSRGDGAVGEILEEGINGFSFEPGDIPALAAHVRWFVENRGTIALFREGSRRIAKRFSLPTAIGNLAAASREALK